MLFRRLVLSVVTLTLASCAAKVSLVDRTNGSIHKGETGSTAGSSGEISAIVDGKSFQGQWIYSASGGAYSLGNLSANVTSTTPMGSAFINGNAMSSRLTMSANGNGLITMNSGDGDFIRCVFTFNTLSGTGIGDCVRNDGRQFDLMIKK